MNRRTELALKRAMDLAGASALLVVLSPLMGVVAILIPPFLGSGGVLFRQKRPGLDEKPFVVLKFRTMLESFDADGRILPESERLTRFGWLLRRLSIDELPQLLNVLRGDMSLVGPRPLLMEYLPAYNQRQRRRHLVKPGISGWAQVNGRHDTTLGQRLELDAWYVDNWSIWLDLKIAALTVTRVLSQRNVKRPDQAVAEYDDLGFHEFVRRRSKTD